MTPKQKVLKKFPKAHSYRWGLPRRYYVTETRESGVVIATSEKSFRDAWAQAAHALWMRERWEAVEKAKRGASDPIGGRRERDDIRAARHVVEIL
jgi:hypothetical protein